MALETSGLGEFPNERKHGSAESNRDESPCLRLVSCKSESDEQSTELFVESDIQKILDALPFYIMLVDEDHKILLANHAMKLSLGFDSEHAVKGYCPKIIHGLDHPFPDCPLEEAVENNCSVEKDLFDPDSDIWVRSSVYPTELRTQEGKVIFFHTVRDITEKRQRIEVMRETNQILQALIQASPLAIIALDIEGKVLIWNQAAERIFGWSEHEVLNQPCLTILDGKDDCVCRPCNWTTQEKLLSDMEVRSRRKDGSQIDISISAAPLYDAVNQIGGTMIIVADITEKKRAEEELKRSLEKFQSSLDGTVYALASIAEKRDPYTAGHQQRVAELACAIAKEIGLTEEQIKGIDVAGNLHDIGKISVPSEMLTKPSQLTDLELNIIKIHPQHGYDILKTIEFPWPVADAVLQHHERMDGSGYPSGLSGEDIILEARILAVADVVEAISSHRPYRPAHGINKALEEISENRGTLYDPSVVDACLKLFKEKAFGYE